MDDQTNWLGAWREEGGRVLISKPFWRRPLVSGGAVAARVLGVVLIFLVVVWGLDGQRVIAMTFLTGIGLLAALAIVGWRARLHPPPPFLIVDAEGVEQVGGPRIPWSDLTWVDGRIPIVRTTPSTISIEQRAGPPITVDPRDLPMTVGAFVDLLRRHGAPVSTQLEVDIRSREPNTWAESPIPAPRPEPQETIADAVVAFVAGRHGSTLVIAPLGGDPRYLVATRAWPGIRLELRIPPVATHERAAGPVADRLRGLGWRPPGPDDTRLDGLVQYVPDDGTGIATLAEDTLRELGDDPAAVRISWHG